MTAGGTAAPEVLAAHLAWVAQGGLAASTIGRRRRILTRLEAAIGTPLCQATAPQLAAWRAGLAAGNDAIAADLSHVRQFYAWAVRAGLVAADPAARLPVPKRSPRLPRPIGESALLYALNAAPARIRPWLVLAGWAGLRACEIALLRRENVLDSASPPALLIARDATKGRHERVVPMSGFVRAELLPVLPASGWVFPRHDARPGPNTPNQVSHLANRHLHDCGYAATLHQLRHRFGTQAYAASRDLRVVQEIMGHAHPSSTAGYCAWSRADAVAAVQALPVPAPRLAAVTAADDLAAITDRLGRHG